MHSEILRRAALEETVKWPSQMGPKSVAKGGPEPEELDTEPEELDMEPEEPEPDQPVSLRDELLPPLWHPAIRIVSIQIRDNDYS